MSSKILRVRDGWAIEREVKAHERKFKIHKEQIWLGGFLWELREGRAVTCQVMSLQKIKYYNASLGERGVRESSLKLGWNTTPPALIRVFPYSTRSCTCCFGITWSPTCRETRHVTSSRAKPRERDRKSGGTGKRNTRLPTEISWSIKKL